MFCAGLLHDLGKLALCTTLPQTYGRVVTAAKKLRIDINVLEEQIIGLTHAAAGRRLAERWQLDATLTATIGLHHEHPATLARLNLPAGDLLAVHIVAVADQLAREMHLGFSGNPAQGGSREVQLEALDITERHLEAIGDELVEIAQTRCDVMGLGRADAGRLYRESIARANAQLSAAPTQRPGAGRDEAFRHLAIIDRELDPASGLLPTLKLIAGSARDAVDDRKVVVVAAVEGGLDLLVDGNVQHMDGAALPTDGETPDWPEATGRVAARLGECGALLVKAEAKLPDDLRSGWATLLSVAVRRERHRDAADASREAWVELAKDGDDRVRSAVTEAVANLAAGAAHELNNPLTIMRGRAELLASNAQDDGQRKAAETIARQAMRLSEMVTDLLRYAQPAEPTVEVLHPR
ncbi:MAG: HDOD domain-containing protein, partial [Planctomycetota bacterium]